MEGANLVDLVTCEAPFWWRRAGLSLKSRLQTCRLCGGSAPVKKVVLYDYGVKFNIIRNLKAGGWKC